MATAARSAESTALQADAETLHAALSELVRVYQFRDRDRICCHDISVTQCWMPCAEPAFIGRTIFRINLVENNVSDTRRKWCANNQLNAF